ncbi:MAG: right-handed parallel beta-helix repeat-containing protein [Phycisphaeraceae bacterium JB051]
MRYGLSVLFLLVSLVTHDLKADQAIELMPTFESCSVYLNASVDVEHCQLQYRLKGQTAWLAGLPMVRSENKPQWRTSILGLDEGKTYDVKITSGKESWEQSFTTWKSDVPIARTVTLTKGPVYISDMGSPDGWVRYIASEALRSDDKAIAAINIDDASYIILDGIKVRGGVNHGIHVANSSYVRIVNCDIAQWGSAGKQVISQRGQYYDTQNKIINYDAGVYIDQSLGVVVERSYIHDPNGQANPWAYAHPAGPCALYMYARGQTVIRYNDLIGSQKHRYNDIIEGNRNGFEDGGFCRDADIYGNMFILGNDDGVELDGGQMNIRVWGNHFSNTLCGVSTAPSLFGPTYIYNNLFSHMGDQNNSGGTGIKNGYKFAGQGMIYLYHNTFDLRTGMNNFGKSDVRRNYIVSRNNVYNYSNELFGDSIISEQNDMDHDLIYSEDSRLLNDDKTALASSHVAPNAIYAKPQFRSQSTGDYRLKAQTPGSDVAVKIAGLPVEATRVGVQDILPIRPASLTVSQSIVEFDSSTQGTITATLANGNDQFHIRKNDAFDWFDVTPMHGTFTWGKPVTFTVKRKDNLPVDQRRFKGCFQITLANGVSRPVTVYAGQDQLVLPSTSDPRVVKIIEAEDGISDHAFEVVTNDQASGGKAIALPRTSGKAIDMDQMISYTFTIPEDGSYFLAARTKAYVPAGHHNSVYISLDGSDFIREEFWTNGDWYWCGLRALGKDARAWFYPFKLTAGQHTIRITPRESMQLDCFAITTDPRVLFLEQ